MKNFEFKKTWGNLVGMAVIMKIPASKPMLQKGVLDLRLQEEFLNEKANLSIRVGWLSHLNIYFTLITVLAATLACISYPFGISAFDPQIKHAGHTTRTHNVTDNAVRFLPLM